MATAGERQPRAPALARTPSASRSHVVAWVSPPADVGAATALVAAFDAEPSWSAELRNARSRHLVLARLVSVLTRDAARRGTLLAAVDGVDITGAACAWEPGYHPRPFRTPGYLIGVRPDYQCARIGQMLLEAFLERVDSSRGSAYLETSRGELLRWYLAAGFVVRDELALSGDRRTWTMWRDAMS